jgi:anti-sigma factor RsiW
MTDCSEIRTLLSEYLDDALDAEAKALADEHLRTCPACREELDSLKTLVKGIGSLESVKAPADFLDQLHQRMERRSKISAIWEWLFYPLRVKIPLQLAGAAVMALIIFSILPLQQPSLKLHSKPEQEKKAEDPSYDVDESKGIKPTARPEALVRKAAAPEPAKVTREVALNLKRQMRAKAATAEPSAAQAPASPAALEMQRQKLAAGAPAQEDKKEEALEKEPEPLLSVTKAIEAAKGKVLSIDHNPQTGRPESVYAEIPAGEIPLLYEKLRELGSLQVSPQTGTEEDSDLVPMKIRLTGLQ